jgi:hypothetical protein
VAVVPAVAGAVPCCSVALPLVVILLVCLSVSRFFSFYFGFVFVICKSIILINDRTPTIFKKNKNGSNTYKN